MNVKFGEYSGLLDDKKFVETNMIRMMTLPDGRNRDASYELIRRFKSFLEKIKEAGLEIE